MDRPTHLDRRVPRPVALFALRWAKLLVHSAGIGALVAAPAVLHAQSATTGIIEGRVLNAASGDYLHDARVVLQGTGEETFTDSLGQYRFTRVPAGPVTITAAYTGLPTQVQRTVVAAGATETVDFAFGQPDTVKLDKMVVTSARVTDPAAIAINEQRFAPNMKTVVSAGEFGSNPSGNVGDFLRFLPGVQIDSNGGDARYILLNGTPPQYVPVTVNGFDLANAASNTTSRTAELEQASLNNIDRVEVVQSPTPESPGNALAGSVNLVPRSAFERARPVFDYSVFAIGYDDLRSLNKIEFARRGHDHTINPGGSFSYVVPVNKRFGFSIAGASSTQTRNQFTDTLTWYGSLSTPPKVNGVPITDSSNPYLADVNLGDNPVRSERNSWSATIDFRPAPNDVLSLAFQWAALDNYQSNHGIVFAPAGVPVSFSPYFTHGALNQSIMLNSSGTIHKSGTTWMPMLTWRHNGPVWRAEAGAAYSHATSRYRPTDGGAYAVALRRQGDITVNYDNNTYYRPGSVSVVDKTGAAVNPYDLSTYSLQSISDIDRDGVDVRKNAYGNVSRAVYPWGVPVVLKTGLDVRQQQRDLNDFGGRTWSYNGPDQKHSLTPVGNDDAVPFLLDQDFSQRHAPFGFPQTQYASPWLAQDLLNGHPDWFTAPTAVGLYNGYAPNSKFIQETVSAAFLRADLSFFHGRMKVITGLRTEQTNVKAESLRTDGTANYQRDASGKTLLDAAGKPLLINPAGSLEEARLVRQARGAHVKKEYLRYFPSMNVSYNLLENLVVRGAYYWSLGRPDLGQYAGGLSLPNLDAAPSSLNRISINNPDIKPWKAYTTKFSLEYYMHSLGVISVDVFRRDFKNFFVGTVGPASPQFLADAGLSQDYAIYDVSTQRNSPFPVRVTGIDINYKQALTFLPHWARGVTVFANETSERVQGVEAGNIVSSSFPPWTSSAGIRLGRDRFSVMVNANYRARFRQNYIAANDTWVYYNRRLNIDAEATYWIRRNHNLGVFLNGSNLRDQPEGDNEVAGSNTPAVAQMRSRFYYGARWTLGVKGTF